MTLTTVIWALKSAENKTSVKPQTRVQKHRNLTIKSLDKLKNMLPIKQTTQQFFTWLDLWSHNERHTHIYTVKTTQATAV